MKDGCLKPEEIAIAWHQGGDGPQSRHLEQCSWCQALAKSLDLFRRDGGLPAGADLQDAEQRLEDFLQREIVGGMEPQDEVPLKVARSGHRRSRPVLWATAAVLILAVSLPAFLDRGTDLSRETVLRSEIANDHIALRLATPQVQANGEILLNWMPLEAATAYDVLLLDGEQREAGRIDAGPETSRQLTSSEVGLLESRPKPWFVLIVARSEADEISRSLPRLLPEGAGPTH